MENITILISHDFLKKSRFRFANDNHDRIVHQDDHQSDFLRNKNCVNGINRYSKTKQALRGLSATAELLVNNYISSTCLTYFSRLQ